MQKDFPEGPPCPQRPQTLSEHGDTRIDPYYWLRDRDHPDTLAYLNAENDYRQNGMKHLESLQEELYQEIKGRIKEDDSSVPYFKNGYWYYVRFETGGEHPIYCRKKESLETEEEVLIDANREAQQHAYYQVGGINISPDNEWMAYGEDTVGRRLHRIGFKHLPTGKILEEYLMETTGSGAWSACGQYFFYTVKDESLRPYKVFRHELQKPAAGDQELYHEEDSTFICSAYKGKSRQYIMIASHSTVSNEFRYLPADAPLDDFQIIQPRQRHLEYGVAHYGDHWYIRTNADGAANFKIMRTSVNTPGREHWEDLIPHREDVYLEGLELFRHYMVLEERIRGLTHLRVRRWDGSDDHYLPFDSETYTAGTAQNPDFDSTTLRYVYSALTTPPSVYDYEMDTRRTHLRKRVEIVGGYEEERYSSERLWASAPDGRDIPISLVYRKDLRKEEGNPLLLYGYGSYGITVDPSFSPVRLSLLDRGFVFAIAHVRGGQYLGRQWYEEGRLLRKQNTFSDFTACAEYLLECGYTTRDQLFGMGGSAGGLLIGAVLNQRPDLFRGAIAAVPFVDVLTTMLDESIPLTTGEYDEWGNPHEKEFYEYIQKYSPYDNVASQDYPALLITTGLHDSQVQYWEPAKWCARLREMKTDRNPLYLYVNMETGHGGASGRFAALRETAMEYAFLLDLKSADE